ncbi:Nuclear transport factor 2 [Coemansia aciculifera]|uniref:Nuclear transport factor 2 n=2 Tax=Coemansia TaxID=4863 RepID=A0A9W8H3M7_9FUNG|nr:Nuclear transport factor 2 [Coemansia sp. S146]KAJ2755006.1 Nuclear transport factor 2 [Coemansia pectinata]KAJ2867486.1 Nuclear transport factor 2 [Coemansia aciculifera]KAJ2872327.1 Nuclear transport factor 2 [Coemansia aciculifera]KAJ2883730.1 Nuclear transport factor 2 [Coemansia aciculifera]
MSNINDIAKQFVEYYYQCFDGDRSSLAPLYRDMSMMSWEGTQMQGAKNIVEKLVSLPFTRVVHKVTTIDAQPSLPNINAVVIAVTGQLLVDDETKPQQYTQLFQLVEDSGFFIYNDIFRLNYA